MTHSIIRQPLHKQGPIWASPVADLGPSSLQLGPRRLLESGPEKTNAEQETANSA